jgi:hypothetical protein
MTFIQTPDGPMLTGSSPDLLQTLLIRYEEVLTSLGGPVADTMNPGLGSFEVEIKLRSRGLSCPDELLVWFGWHNGVMLEGLRTAGIPGLFPAGLDACLAAYDQSRSELEDYVELDLDYESLAYGATEGWLRLQSISESIAVECARDGASPPRTRWANLDFTDPTYAGRFRAVSLCTTVARWIESAEAGAFEWRPTDHRWIVNDEFLLTDLTGSPLG